MDSKGITMKDNEGNKYYPCPYYPIGSIYLSVTNINPANYFGGIWEQIENVFLLACSDKHKAGSTGGEENHTLTVEEMPKHKHTANTIFPFSPGSNYTGVPNSSATSYNAVETGTINATGGNKAHNNMPPYLAVYMWKRVA